MSPDVEKLLVLTALMAVMVWMNSQVTASNSLARAVAFTSAVGAAAALAGVLWFSVLVVLS